MKPLYSIKKPRFYHESYSSVEDFVTGEQIFEGKLHIDGTHIMGEVYHRFRERLPLCLSYKVKTGDFVGTFYLEGLEIKNQGYCRITGKCPLTSRQYHSVLYKDNRPVFKIEHIEPFATCLVVYGLFTERIAVNWLVDYKGFNYKIKEKGQNWIKIQRKL